MKVLIFSIYVMLSFQAVLAADKKAKPKVAPVAATSTTCSSKDILDFKQKYIDLQNILMMKNKKIELVKGKAQAVGPDVVEENAPGHVIELALYHQYQNALTKVGKIYQQFSVNPSTEDKKILNENPALVNFFKSIESTQNTKSAANLNIDTLLDKLEKLKPIKGFELTKEDLYLLKRLLLHSQDVICRVEKEKNKKGQKLKNYDSYMKESLNMMIRSLNNMAGKKEFNYAYEQKAIDQAMKAPLEKLAELKKAFLICKAKFQKNPDLGSGDKVQECNYKKFIETLTSNNFNHIESLLHFINANQLAENATTDLDLIKKEEIKAREAAPQVPAATKPEVQTTPQVATAVMPTPAATAPVVETCTDPKTVWKKGEGQGPGKCVPIEVTPEVSKEELDCKAKQTGDIPPNTFVFENKTCVDRRIKKKTNEEKEETPPEVKPDVVYPNKPVPGRFQPITIPTRQVYILPGMP